MTTTATQESRPAVRSIRGVHCWKCLRVFMEKVSPPYRYVCRRNDCGAVNEEK